MTTSRRQPKRYVALATGVEINPPPPYGDGKVLNSSFRFATDNLNDDRVTGDNVPDYREMIKRNESATSSLIGVKHSYRMDTGNYSRTTPWPSFPYTSKFTLSGNVYAGLTPYDGTEQSVLDQARAQAQINFAKDVRKKTRTFQSGVFMGELLESIRYLKNPLVGMKKGYEDFATACAKASKKYPITGTKPGSPRWKAGRQALQNAWLENNYAMRPLINDVNDAAESFNGVVRGDRYDPIKVTGRGEASKVVDLAIAPTAGNIAGWANGMTMGERRVITASVKVYGVWKNMNPAGEMPLASRFGADFSNFLPTAWELIPWSFVIDYFSNMGDTIDAWSMRFIDFGWINQSERTEFTRQYTNFRPSEAGNPVRYAYYPRRTGLSRFTRVDRRAVSNVFAPALSMRIPGYESSRKWLSVAALGGTVADMLSNITLNDLADVGLLTDGR